MLLLFRQPIMPKMAQRVNALLIRVVVYDAIMATEIIVDPDVEGVWRVMNDPPIAGPNVAVVGGTHGNEPCGIEAIRRLLSDAKLGRLGPITGTLTLIHGNPEATRQDRRFTKGGRDLNRLLNYSFLYDLPRSNWTIEHHRALALRPILESIDLAIDLHSTASPSPAFVIVPPMDESLTLAKKLGVPYLTVGWENPGLVNDQVLIGFMLHNKKAALCVECGSHDDPHAKTVAYDSALAFLQAAQLIEGEPPASDVTMALIRITDVLTKPSPEFRFLEDLKGMDRLVAGQALGEDNNLEFRMKKDCFALMPNDRVPVGVDMLYLGVAEEFDFPALKAMRNGETALTEAD
jgi:succinylglutamate desuccinylase